MKYIKTYCYAEHEIDFIKAQLIASEGSIDCVVVYEYDVTHRGDPKPFRLTEAVKHLDPHLAKRLVYRPVSISYLSLQTTDSNQIHQVNEPVQRSYFFNDDYFNLEPNDFIIDCDVDEIIYSQYYKKIEQFLKIVRVPVSLPLNTFYYRRNYLWTDCNFRSPAAYFYKQVKKPRSFINDDFKICHRRDLRIRYPSICGAHMSWIMPVEAMIVKLRSYSHPEYEKYADKEVLLKAIEDKKYIFDETRPFNIEELDPRDARIPLW